MPLLWLLLWSACASTTAAPGPTTAAGEAAGAAAAGDGAAAASVPLCDHRVPAEECTRHHPELAAKFQKMNDWCAEHGVPESHCHECHPGLTFHALPALPPDADLVSVSNMGEDVPSLAAHVAPGKVTVFDFYAHWCAPCKKVDQHVYQLLQTRKDLAYRKLNVMSWDSPLAKRYLAKVPTLPFVVVFGADGKEIEAISGLDLAALDRAIARGVRP